MKRNIEDDIDTTYSIQQGNKRSGCIDAYAGQKVTMFYETFQNILFFILCIEMKLNNFHEKDAPKHTKNLTQQLH